MGYFSQRSKFKTRRNWFDNIIGAWHRANYAISSCKSNLLSDLHFVAELKHNVWEDRQFHFYFRWLYVGWLRASRGKVHLQRIILDHRSMKLTVWLPLITGLASRVSKSHLVWDQLGKFRWEKKRHDEGILRWKACSSFQPHYLIRQKIFSQKSKPFSLLLLNHLSCHSSTPASCIWPQKTAYSKKFVSAKEKTTVK